MDRPKATPKDFFLWAGAMITLYASAFAFVALMFDYLNYAFPDTLNYYGYADPYSGSISYEMATLIVLLPLFLILMRAIRHDIAQDSVRADIWVRRWALYLTLFVAGATVAGDLITLIMYFLNGDTSVRFLLKVLVILLVAGGGFLHFLADLRGYWHANPRYARMVSWGVGVAVLLSIIAGFFIVGTPWQARLYRYDEQKVADLQNLQYQIINYWQAKGALPSNLSELADPTRGSYVPVDPETGSSYEYNATGTLTFELCATFNAPSRPQSIARTMPIEPPGYGKGNESWNHGEDRTCFERTIDPAFYPPLDKQIPVRPID
jgi:hypothetical protein